MKNERQVLQDTPQTFTFQHPKIPPVKSSVCQKSILLLCECHRMLLTFKEDSEDVTSIQSERSSMLEPKLEKGGKAAEGIE
jgi:hypothetical protein